MLIERRVVAFAVASWLTSSLLPPRAALAAKDCYTDCTENCNRVAPRSVKYCENSCIDYCGQDDRRDGLSGSVSSEGAEVGLISAYDLGARATGKQRAVPYGEDQFFAPGNILPSGLQEKLRSAVNGER